LIQSVTKIRRSDCTKITHLYNKRCGLDLKVNRKTNYQTSNLCLPITIAAYTNQFKTTLAQTLSLLRQSDVQNNYIFTLKGVFRLRGQRSQLVIIMIVTFNIAIMGWIFKEFGTHLNIIIGETECHTEEAHLYLRKW